MKYEWQLQDAKNRLSRLVMDAEEKGPQTITVRGKPKVVVVAVGEYRRLSRSGGRLFDMLAKSPLKGLPLDVERDKDTGRDVKL